MKRVMIMVAVFTVTTLPVPALANEHVNLDRFEDRIDRLESRRDERVDHGARDVFEDRVDRWESRLDRAGHDNTPRLDRWERRSWARRWH